MELMLIAIAVLVVAATWRMTAVVSTGLNVAGLRSEFFNRFDGTPTYYDKLSTRIPSTKDAETYRWLGTVPTMREWGTGRKAQGLRTESYSVENMKYESTLEVDRDELADDQTGQIRVRVGELARRAATHKDYLLGQLLVNGASSGFNSYDGVTFFNDAHVSGASGSQDNTLTYTAGGTTKTTGECKGAIQNAIAAMLGFVDDRGAPMAIDMSALVCVVPPAFAFQMMEAVNASIISNTSNVLAGVAAVEINPYLTSTTTWYLCKTDGIVRPFIFQDREPLEFGALEAGSEEEFKREKYLYGVRARYRMTFGYWQYCIRIVFSQ